MRMGGLVGLAIMRLYLTPLAFFSPRRVAGGASVPRLAREYRPGEPICGRGGTVVRSRWSRWRLLDRVVRCSPAEGWRQPCEGVSIYPTVDWDGRRTR